MTKTMMRKAALATAGIALTGGVAFGATEAFAASPGASTSTATANLSPASATVSAAATTGSKTAAACKDAKHPARCDVRRAAGRERSALLKRGAHGQSSIKDKAGAYVVHEWQAGKVESISGSSVTVTDGTGTTWTWTVESATKYRVDGKKGALSGVHVGDTILIQGEQSGSANEATAVFDPNQSKI
jgi:uncharacterized cupredoxin-like copper-binding protein